MTLNLIPDFLFFVFSHPDARISTAIVLPGSNIANHIKLFDRMKAVLHQTPHVYVASLGSKDMCNLKTAIAFLIKNLTENEEVNGTDDTEEGLHYDKRLRYDFDILAEWCRTKVRKDEGLNSLHDMRIVISIDDAHSFDIGILTSLIKQLQSYITRIPLKLVLSVATSIYVFQENMRRSCIRLIHGISINAHLTGCLEEVMLDTLLEANDPTDLLIGPNAFRNIVRRQRESLESIDSFVSSLKYTYMTYFYSNPLSIIPSLLAHDSTLSYHTPFITKYHYSAVRLLPSFKVYIEDNLKDLPEEMVSILDDDEKLFPHIRHGVSAFLQYKARLLYGINILEALQQYVYFDKNSSPSTPRAPVSRIDLYSAALMGEILKSKFYRNFKIYLPKSTVPALSELLRMLKPDRPDDLWPCYINPMPKPFMDLYYRILEQYNTTIGQFLQLDNNFSIISGSTQTQDQAVAFVNLFRSICNMFFETLEEEVFVGGSYKAFFLHELFIVDTPSLQDNVFMPTYRAAIEMALSNPNHYWGEIAVIAARERQKVLFKEYMAKKQKNGVANGHEIVDPSLLENNDETENGVTAAEEPKSLEESLESSSSSTALTKQPSENEWSASAMAYDPHLCILYTLYRESSLFINIYDYYTAFSSVIKQPQDENDPTFERRSLAWFLQGVAELKLLGILRDSKRKFECVEKLVWRGL